MDFFRFDDDVLSGNSAVLVGLIALIGLISMRKTGKLNALKVPSRPLWVSRDFRRRGRV